MRYFKLKVKRFYENDMIATNAEGIEIEDADYYFGKMDKGEVLNYTPIFDYFYLKSYDKEEFWEWQINDVHDFIGKGSRIPGWLISKEIKGLLENYKVALPHFYYQSKLLYKKDKLEYYIFQFSGKEFRNQLTNYIDFNKSIFYDPNNNIEIVIQNEKELIFQQEKILAESGFDIINVPIKKLVLNDNIDFISMQNFIGDKIVSERLKQAIEENNITGFEFSELDYEVVIE